MQLLAEDEHDTGLSPDKQAAFEPLSRAKQELASALEKFHAQRTEIESNEKRLSDAQKEEQDLLASEMDEADQVGKLNQIVALQRLLGSKIEAWRNRLDSSKAELQRATAEALERFQRALAALRDSRNAENLARLKELVDPEKWQWAETHAAAFIRYASDVTALDMLGDQSAMMLRGGAVGKAAENLLMDIAKLQALAGGKSR